MDLKLLSDKELIDAYNQVEAQYDAELSMDGSGECSHFIYEAFEETFKEFEDEFLRRNIPFSEMEEEMPY